MIYHILLFVALAMAEIIAENPLIADRPYFTENDNSVWETWPVLSSNKVVADRTQRDVSANISIALNTYIGVDMKQVVFESIGYNTSALLSTENLLNVGFNAFVLDVYFNNYTNDWGLCPQSIMEMNEMTNSSLIKTDEKPCDVSTFNFDSLTTTFEKFILLTNNILETNPLLILLKLHQISYKSKEYATNSSFLSYDFTGQDVLDPDYVISGELPTLNTLLRKMQRRVIPIIIESDMQSWYPEPGMFYSTALKNTLPHASTLSPSNFISLKYEDHSLSVCDIDTVRGDNSSLLIAHDSDEVPFTEESFWSSIMCGYSPIISHSVTNLTNLSTFLDVSLWSWAAFQPTSGNMDLMNSADFLNILNYDGDDDSSKTLMWKSMDLHNGTNSLTNSSITDSNIEDEDDGGDLFVNRCAVLTSAGWIATSCLNKFHSLCQNKKVPSEIKVTEDKSDYINAPDKCSNMGGYKLYVPNNSIDQLLAIDKIPAGEPAVWIDLNSLSSENCWVVGIYTDCPYQIVVSKKLFVEMMIPSAIMAFLLFVLIFLFQFDRQPVLQNKKYWRKAYAEVDDPDGRPI